MVTVIVGFEPHVVSSWIGLRGEHARAPH